MKAKKYKGGGVGPGKKRSAAKSKFSTAYLGKKKVRKEKDK
jgi:hypothetical protein